MVIAEKTAAAALKALWRMPDSRTAGSNRGMRMDWLSSGAKLADSCAAERGPQKSRASSQHCAGGRREAKYFGGLHEQMSLLRLAAESGCAWCDVEVESAERLDEFGLDELRQVGARVMISFHDFRGTPRDLLKSCPTIGSLRRRCDQNCGAVSHDRRQRSRVGDRAGPPRRGCRSNGRNWIARRVCWRCAREARLRMPQQIRPQRRDNLSSTKCAGCIGAEKLNRQTRVYGVIGNPIATFAFAAHAQFCVRGASCECGAAAISSSTS